MNRLGLVIGVSALLAVAGYLGYRGYENYQATQRQVASLSQQVKQTKELAEKQGAAAAEARQDAANSAKSAAAAAEQRQQAETARKESDEKRQQAEVAREQATVDAQKSAEQAQNAQKQVEQMKAEREKELNDMREALNRIVETRRTANGMVMVLPDSTFRFAFDNADLTQKNRELLSRIAGILLVSKGYGLAVYGYTDDVGTAEYNLALSDKRAKAVEQYLIQAGVPAGIVSRKGFGKTSPLVQGNGSDARARNRRVEIAVTDSQVSFPSDDQPAR